MAGWLEKQEEMRAQHRRKNELHCARSKSAGRIFESVLAGARPTRGAAQGRNRRATSVFGGRVARPRVDSRRRIPRLLQHCSGRLRSHFAGLGILSKSRAEQCEGNEERGFYLLLLRCGCSAVPQIVIFSSHLLHRDTLIFLRKRAFVVAGGQIPAGATSDRICGQHSRHSHCTAMPSLLCYCWRRGRASVASRCVEPSCACSR